MLAKTPSPLDVLSYAINSCFSSSLSHSRTSRRIMRHDSAPAEGSGCPKLKKRIVFQKPPARKHLKIPRARDLSENACAFVCPSEEVRKRIGPGTFVVGVDIETHDWETNGGSKGGFGQFGHYARCNSNDHAARIVQLGWAARRADGPPETKERLVKPHGYWISEKAAKFHGVTHDRACAHGMPLRDVLLEFMEDMHVLTEEGARMVVHHLEFDCGIISKELGRAGLDHLQEEWANVARRGLCTMDPSIGQWVRTCKGLELAPYHTGNTMKLDDMLRCLAPDVRPVARHSAGQDAHLHVLLFDALYNMVLQTSGTEGNPKLAS